MDKFYPEQQVAHDNLVKSRGGLLFWKVGTGKTRIALEVFATLQKVYKWPFPCICLFVCKPKCFYDIRMETVKIGFDCVTLEDDYSSAEITQVFEQMCTKPTLLLVSHAMLDKRLEYLDRCKWIKMVILDDGYLFKNPRAAKTLAANRLTMGRRGLLISGSIMTQEDTTDIYGQALAVNQHRRIAPNITYFRGEYFHCKLLGNTRIPLYSPKKGSYQKIVDALGDCANFFFPKNSERKIHEQILSIPAAPKQQQLFDELREWYSAKDFGVELDYALQVSQRVQQVSNGWITNEHGLPCLVANDKMARTKALVEEILSSGKSCIIWCAFIQDVIFLQEHLPFATLQMSSHHKFDLEKWQSAGPHVAICTEASGVGFNHFEQTPYAIYFSMGWKWLDLQQSRGRTDRRASQHPEVFYYYLQTEGGLDAKIYQIATSAGSKEELLIAIGEWKQNGV